MTSTRSRPEETSEICCEACGKTVPRLQATRCASCKRLLCRLCVRWYGHFMLVCEDCRAGEW